MQTGGDAEHFLPRQAVAGPPGDVELNSPLAMLADKEVIKPGEIRDSKFTKAYKKF